MARRGEPYFAGALESEELVRLRMDAAHRLGLALEALGQAYDNMLKHQGESVYVTALIARSGDVVKAGRRWYGRDS